ncbi:claudin-10 [Electrophorus electricus]|nr:claudin-10 [Electrophorus electricus]
MNYRTVIMYAEIGCFVTCVCGWILVCSTIAIEQWTYSSVARTVITTAHFFSNLWQDCTSDSTGKTDCKEFPSLLDLQMYIHLCRALIITSIILGLFGDILALVGMKCTKLGGSEMMNARITFTAGMIYFASGFCAMFAFSWYGNKVISGFLDPNHRTLKYEIGSALFIGWGGSALLIVGGFLYSIFAGMEGCQSSPKGLVSSAYEVPSSDTLEPSKQALTLPPSLLTDMERRKSKHFSQAYQKDEYV